MLNLIHRLKTDKKFNTFFIICLCWVLCGIVFLIDISLPLAIATTAPYALIVLLSLLTGKPLWTLTFAISSTVLTLTAFYMQQPQYVSIGIVMTNRALNLFVIWMAAILGILAIRERVLRGLVEGSLIKSESDLRTAQRIAHIGSFEIDPKIFSCSSWSKEAINIIGFSQSPEGITMDQFIQSYIHTMDRHIFTQTVNKSLEDGIPFTVELHLSEENSSSRIIQIIGDPVVNIKGGTSKFSCTIHDITDRRTLEEEMLQIGERIQKQIGQDLHDGLGQKLTAITFVTELLRKKLAEKKLKEADDAERILNLITQSIDQARDLSHGLFPVELTRHGLVSAIRELIAQMRSMGGTQFTIDFENTDIDLNPLKSIHIFRITQEAINNAVKHSHAKHIKVYICKKEHIVTLTIEDDGKGIEKQSSETHGLGLHIMEYRANVIGAKFTILSESGKGTKISCEFHDGRIHNFNAK